MALNRQIKQAKLYYSHSEAAKELKEAPSTIRFWVEQFYLKKHSSGGGNIRYDLKTMEQLRHIKYLLRDKRLTIEGARNALKVPQTQNNAQVAATLKELKEQLVQLRHSMDKYQMGLASRSIKKELEQ
ncbi:MAG: MerR family transcriptional regulator [Porphyromonas sp.]|nr:MerR family transcriptional regulator [Porphyromonas sp.]